ncbi:MAG: AAA family ATPase [Thermodesulfobacteriota bacterium]
MSVHLRKIRFFPQQYPTREHYPFRLELFQKMEVFDFTAPVVLLAGENGSGKSTLLEAVARKCGIHIWKPEERTRVNYNPYEDELYKYTLVDWVDGPVPGSFFAAEIFKNFAQNLDEWAATNPGQLKYFGGRSLLTQSHGQSLMSFFRSRYQIKGLYLLDEPETALSPQSQLDLLAIVKEMSRAGHAQFVIATHSPILLAVPGAHIYCLDQVPIQRVEYLETEHYRLYRDFLNHPERYCR